MSRQPIAAAADLPAQGAPRATLRFAEKRETILDGAARLFNRRGIKAGTLSEVAASVGLATNSLTYYYRKKEDLVCACLLRSIAAIDGLITAAEAAPDLAGRVRALVQGFVALLTDIAEQRRPELIFFGDMRALPAPQAQPAFDAYVAMFRHLRRLLRQGPAQVDAAGRRALNARTHGLLAQVMWLRAWLGRYESSDYPRVGQTMADLLLHGLAAPDQRWPAEAAAAPVRPASRPGDEADALRDAYLRTATRLVNDHGVGGASVERIAATLALTKGSFYHHHDTKDALIDACFERSFALIRGVQRAALAAPGNGWQRLVAAIAPLVQLHQAPGDGPGPLLRLTAWTELPGALRWQKYNSLGRLGERYAAMVVDGMVDGSIRITDPAVAAQLIHGLVNALAEVQHWVPEAPQDGGAPLAELLAQPLLMGLLADPSASDRFALETPE